MFLKFDPDNYKVTNSFGGYDPNQKGLFKYPRPLQNLPSRWGRYVQRPTSSYPCCEVEGSKLNEQINDGEKSIEHIQNVFRNPILDPVTKHYNIFVQDPVLPKKKEGYTKGKTLTVEDKDNAKGDDPDVSPCGIRRLTENASPKEGILMKRPIDPIHWKSDLFDTSWEKYYLRNLLIEDPYREFFKSSSEATIPQHYCSEYKQSYSDNPVMLTSSSGRILGLSRPTDISEPCHWKRYKTQKLRDVIFTHEKDSMESNLDYNDPKRYNPWPRLKMSYDQMLESNYRPRPRSGVEYSTTTLLPAVSPYSKQWII